MDSVAHFHDHRLMAGLKEAEVAALEHRLSRRTFPIIADGDGGLLGSCFLIRVDGHELLVTAEHVIEIVLKRPNDFGVPVRSDGDSEMWTLGKSVAGYEKRLDAACVRLDPRVLEKLLEYWEPIDLDGAVVAPAASYLAFGYPGDTTSVNSPEAVASKPEFVRLKPLAHPLPPFPSNARAYDERADIILQPWEAATVLGPGDAPVDPGGMSGAAMWAEAPTDDKSRLWVPGRDLKLAGVQVAHTPGSYTRATRIEVVHAIATRLLKATA